MWGKNWQTQSWYKVHRIQGGQGKPEASGPHFTVVSVPLASPSNVEGEGAELYTKEKRAFSINGIGKNWVSTSRSLKLDHFLSHCIKVNSNDQRP
jgi:hypothetical protein